MKSVTDKQTLLQLGKEKRLEGVVIDRASDEQQMTITIRLDSENLVKGLDFLAAIGLLEKQTPEEIID